MTIDLHYIANVRTRMGEVTSLGQSMPLGLREGEKRQRRYRWKATSGAVRGSLAVRPFDRLRTNGAWFRRSSYECLRTSEGVGQSSARWMRSLRPCSGQAPIESGQALARQRMN